MTVKIFSHEDVMNSNMIDSTKLFALVLYRDQVPSRVRIFLFAENFNMI